MYASRKVHANEISAILNRGYESTRVNSISSGTTVIVHSEKSGTSRFVLEFHNTKRAEMVATIGTPSLPDVLAIVAAVVVLPFRYLPESQYSSIIILHPLFRT